MLKIVKSAPLYVFPVLALLLALAFRISGLPAVESFQNVVFDSFQRLKPRSYEDAAVRIIDLDDKSLSRLGQWPWPRPVVARLVDKLAELGVAVIAFDVVYSEPDQTTPSNVLSLWPQTEIIKSLRRDISRLPDHDRILAKAFSKTKVVAGFSLIGEANAFVPAVKAGFAYGGDSPLMYLQDFPGAVINLPVLEEAAAGNGNFGLANERDGIIRRVPLVARRGSAMVPSLSLEALRLAQDASNIMIRSSGASAVASYGEHTGINAIRVGEFEAPTDAFGRMWVYYTKTSPGRTIAAWEIFEKGFARERLEGTIAYVGTSAAGLKDLRTTPLQSGAPGVEVHANATEQILLKRFINRPDWATGAEVVYLLVLGILLISLFPRMGAAWAALLSASSVAAAFAFSWHAFTDWHWLLDPVFPSMVVFVIYLTSSLIVYLRTESEKRQIRGAFSRYMSPDLVKQLAEHPEKLVLGGEMREMTFHFCDVRGFTTISEMFDPKGLTQLLNRLLTPMTDVILQNKGTIDKYIGDCIMAYWNAPLDDPDHARNACRAALEMHRRLIEVNAENKARIAVEGGKYVEIHIGTGLNTGPCVVGNMGSEQRFDYSVLGDDVNLASRLEGQSKTYGVNIVIGPNTRAQAPEFAALELDLLRVKGKTQPVRIYALLAGPDEAQTPAFKKLAGNHESMLTAYRKQDWAEAERLIVECRAGGMGLSGLYDLYVSRINAYREQPPAPDWDGVYIATSK